MNKKGFIYQIYSDLSPHCYIGQTSRPVEKRYKEHLYWAFVKQSNWTLYQAMRKYGKNHIFVKIIEECDIQKLNEREQYWIKYFNSFYNGWNETLGGGRTKRMKNVRTN